MNKNTRRTRPIVLLAVVLLASTATADGLGAEVIYRSPLFSVSTGYAGGGPLTGSHGESIASSVSAIPVPQNLDDLIRQLGSNDATERAMAACQIGRMRSSDVRPAMDTLLALLGDDTPVDGKLCREGEDWGDRWKESSPGREAAIALEEVGRAAVEPLIAKLEDDNPAARKNAAFALGLIEDDRAVDPLIRTLRDGVADVRARSAWSLGMIEDARAVEPLVSVLDDASAEVREDAAWALGMIEDSRAVTGLSRALEDREPEVREQAAWALGMIEAESGVAALTGAVEDPDADVREQVVWALGMIEAESAVPALTRALDDDVADVREQAAWALGMIEAASAVPGLGRALEDEVPDVREQAAWALGMIESPDATPALIAALKDERVLLDTERGFLEVESRYGISPARFEEEFHKQEERRMFKLGTWSVRAYLFRTLLLESSFELRPME